MAFRFQRHLMILFTLLVLLQVAKGQDDQPEGSEEEDDSSSEETVEDSNENAKRRRRSAEFADKSEEVNAKPGFSIPGLPGPEIILKIAEMLTTVGQEVLPIFVQGNSMSNFVTDRINRDVKFADNFKNEIDMLIQNLKRK